MFLPLTPHSDVAMRIKTVNSAIYFLANELSILLLYFNIPNETCERVPHSQIIV